MGSFKAILKRTILGAGIGAAVGGIAGADWKRGAMIGAVVGLVGEPVKTMLIDTFIVD